jgi:glutathione S-transferase
MHRMKLYTSDLSPFARKCRIVAAELGLSDRVELVPQSVSPITPDAGYLRANPLGKIPALVTDEGHTLFDSHVICEYLCSLAGDTRLVPTGASRFDVLTRQALASGMTDAVILVRYETALRPETQRWPDWTSGQWRKFDEGLGWFEAHAGVLDGPLDLAQIALACGLGYTDVRFPDRGWRAGAPRIAAWYAQIETLPVFDATRPKA